MENRFSRASSQRSATASDLDDALYPVHYHRPGPSLAISTQNRRPPPSPSRDYVPARSSSPEDVFADPADSPPPSPNGSAFYSSSVITPTPSVRRPSLSLSARRPPSPLPGGNTGHHSHHRLSQSLTPSLRSSSSSMYGPGGGLNRSNTTGTTATAYSALSSIPSNLSDLTSPPSPLPPIAPVRPQWNYGGHQQNIYPESVNTGSVVPEEMGDPFADDYMIPVGDGFAPHYERPPPAIVFPSGASSVGSIEPPPYTRYPDPPKPEDIGVPLRVQVSNGDSGVDVGREGGGGGGPGALSAAGGVGLLGAGAVHGGVGADPDDGSGAHKEWESNRLMGFKVKFLLLGIAIGLLILLAVGLGVGLGVGLHQNHSPAATTVYPTSELPPPSEETGPPLSSPNDTFPVIPTGMAILNPLFLHDQSSSCTIAATDASAPVWFDMGANLFWSCAFNGDDPNNALSWRFEKFPTSIVNMEQFNSEPDFLRGAEYGMGAWGGYLVSSFEGIKQWEDDEIMVVVDGNGNMVEYPVKVAWKDGAQNQPFWRIPLAFYNMTMDNSNRRSKRLVPPPGGWHKRLSSRTDEHPLDESYKFGILFNKTVIVKQSTINQNIARPGGVIKSGNGTALAAGEIVWKCVWEKTLLEVEVSVDVASAAFTHSNGTDPGLSHSYTDVPCPTNCSCPDCNGPGPTHGPPPPPPPPPPPHYDDDPFGPPTPTPSNDNFYKKQRRQVYERNVPDPYQLKVSVRESRPSNNRIRELLGIDLTDTDPKGRADLGPVRCTQYVVTNDGRLSLLVDKMTGEGYVVLKELNNNGGWKGRLRERGTGVAGLGARDGGGCCCEWNS